MVRFEFNGAPFNKGDLQGALLKVAMESVAEQLKQKIGSIRHPETGEFPTIVLSGSSLEDIQMQIEGSPELVTLVKERLESSGDEVENDISGSADIVAPKVFLSYAWEDKNLASQIAHALQANGIETWWAEWCISAGDSIRQKIDEGLGDCTHFVVLLTQTSLKKPWVNQEMDAGLMLKLQAQTKFIPLRHQLPAEDIPPLLRGTLAPSIDDPDRDIHQLINDIHGVVKKPPLGKKPTIVTQGAQQSTGYSAAANAVAKVFVETTQHAFEFDPHLSLNELVSTTGLPKDDVVDALHELSNYTVDRKSVTASFRVR